MVDSMIRLFESTATSFSTNGIGCLPDASKCEVTEERNGSFELEMEYHLSGKRYSDLALRRILVAQANPYSEPQPFRIYEISKPINGIVTVKAEHISYDMTGYPVAPYSATNASEAMSGLASNAIVSSPFSFSTDISSSVAFSTVKPASMRNLLGGDDGSILDTYGGELEFDGFKTILHAKRGANRGVTIRYGKNMTDLTQEENCSNVYTAVYPFWYSDEWGLITLPEKTIASPGTYDYTKIYPLDLSGEWENTYEWSDEYPSEDELRELAETYISENNIGVPTVSLTVSFENLSQSGEYEALEALETVCLCDTVNVEFPKLGVSSTSKCIKTVYNVLTEKYESIELGDPESNLVDTISSTNSIVSDTVGRTNVLERTSEHTLSELKTLDESTTSRFEQTAEQIQTEVTNRESADNVLSSTITQTASAIRSEVSAGDSKLQSSIEQTASQIRSEVSNGDSNLQSIIEQTASAIRSEVSSGDGNLQTQINQNATNISSKVNKGDVCSEINQSAEQITLKSNRLVIDSTNFTLSADGKIVANSGTISGITLGGSYGDGFYFTDGSYMLASGLWDMRSGVTLYGGLEVYGLMEFRGTNFFVYGTDKVSFQGTQLVTCSLISPDNSNYGSNNLAQFSNIVLASRDYVQNYHQNYTSDRRLKKNVEPITDTISDRYMHIQPVSYQFKAGVEEGDDGRVHFGYIAQNVDEYFDKDTEQIVSKKNETYCLNYQEFHALHTAMIQKHEREIEALKAEITALKAQKGVNK